MSIKLLTILALIAAMCVSACSYAKPVARTVNEAAQVACETSFRNETLPQGVTAEQLCADLENQQPFIRNILAAKKAAASANGISLSEEEEN